MTLAIEFADADLAGANLGRFAHELGTRHTACTRCTRRYES